MCQTKVERLFDRMWPSQIRKVASLFAQALSWPEILWLRHHTLGRTSAPDLLPYYLDSGLRVGEPGRAMSTAFRWAHASWDNAGSGLR
jgi:hypothetical protein